MAAHIKIGVVNEYGEHAGWLEPMPATQETRLILRLARRMLRERGMELTTTRVNSRYSARYRETAS
jgi:hypothetical protein